MPSLTGNVVLVLTVSDPEASSRWYRNVFGMDVVGDYEDPGSGVRSICLQESESKVEICLRSHVEGQTTRFDETMIGLDHAEFLVAERSDLDGWVRHLDEVGVAHSDIKAPEHSKNAMITFRDPDNIQLELFWIGKQVPQVPQTSAG